MHKQDYSEPLFFFFQKVSLICNFFNSPHKAIFKDVIVSNNFIIFEIDI